MKQDCTLMATLPNLWNDEKVQQILECPQISEARFNTGVSCLMGANEVVSKLRKLSMKYSKKIWIELKGRQLRVVNCTDSRYETIELDHRINVTYPAKIYFRNGGFRDLLYSKGNKVVVAIPRQETVGAGQPVNIVAKELNIEGYLTELDKQYLMAANWEGMNGILASFVEKLEDLKEITAIMPNADIVAKIESLKGMELVSTIKLGKLMAARDNLYIESGQNYSMMRHLETILKSDSNAICASKIFCSLENGKIVDFADFADLTLMYNLGYRSFMLCENICNYHFKEAIAAWKEFCSG